jgi:hypothetical protein
MGGWGFMPHRFTVEERAHGTNSTGGRMGPRTGLHTVGRENIYLAIIEHPYNGPWLLVTILTELSQLINLLIK